MLKSSKNYSKSTKNFASSSLFRSTRIRVSMCFASVLLGLASLSVNAANRETVEVPSESLIGPGRKASEVLNSSEILKLSYAIPSTNLDARAILMEDFKILKKALGFESRAELHILSNEWSYFHHLAQTVQRTKILVDESLARFPQNQRLFVLGHEMGHVELKHFESTAEAADEQFVGITDFTVYVPNLRERVAALAEVSKKHETEADVFSVLVLKNEPLAKDGEKQYAGNSCAPAVGLYGSTQDRLLIMRIALGEPDPGTPCKD